MAKFQAKGSFALYTVTGEVPIVLEGVVRNRLRSVLNRVGREIIKDTLDATVQSWDRKPKWNLRFTVSPQQKGRIGFSIETDSDVWLWLNYGTDVRYALMSGNYVSKTIAGVIPSRGGRGRMVLVDPGSIRKPGVEARLWTDAVILLYSGILLKAVRDVIESAGFDRFQIKSGVSNMAQFGQFRRIGGKESIAGNRGRG